ncbi:MAG: hypothetical protein CL916_10270 [Deltaproteobacteria bacterium]|nr:hypothetical protein [Deltaproteobacteria bacterium]
MAPKPKSITDIPILSHPICALDFETTGLNKTNQDRAVEIALVRREPNGNIHAWSSLIKSPKSIPVESQKIHNISNAMILDAPSFQDIYPRIEQFLKDSILIAHHSPFDITFLKKECAFIQKPVPNTVAVLDTLTMARSFLNLPRNNLSSLSKRIGITPHNAHRAMSDARNALFLFLEIMTQYPKQDLTVRNVKEIIENRKPKGIWRNHIHRKVRLLVKKPQKIQIRYSSSAPERPLFQERIVTPIRIRDQYLEAFCELRQDKREFRISRIHSILELQSL